MKKITNGFVIQTFDENGKCTHQEFIAGDIDEYEDDDGNYVDIFKHTYFPYEMKQPE